VDKDGDEDDGQVQQAANSVAAAVTAKRIGDNHLSGKEDGSPRPAERRRLLPFAIHCRSQAMTRQEAVAMVTATTSLATKLTRTRIMGGYALLSSGGSTRLTMT
jgi:hypothetical protein